jgi:hypothetical protein
MVKTVAKWRTTFINQRTLSIIFLVFSFCLTYVNYIMAGHNKCNGTVLSHILFLWELSCPFACTYTMYLLLHIA